MSAAVKAALATILIAVLICVLAYVETVYTHGLLTLILMVMTLLGAIFVVLYIVFDSESIW